MADTHQVQHIAITFDDGSVGIMSFILDPNVPQNLWVPGMRGDNVREATDEAVQYEINKTNWNELKPVSWRRVAPTDIPTDRTDRDAWADDGQKIFVHPDRKAKLDAVKAANPTIEQRLAALEAKGKPA